MSKKRKFMLGDEVIFDTKYSALYLRKKKGIITRLLAGYKADGISMNPSYEVTVDGKVLPCSPSECRLFNRPFKNIIEVTNVL